MSSLQRAVIQDDLKRTTLLPSLGETQIVRKLFEIGTNPPRSARSTYPPPGVERHATNIFVTPLVHSIAHRYFKSQLEMVGPKPKYYPQTPQVRRKDPVITTPLNLGKDESDDGSIKYYPSIVFEEEHHYKVRESVCVSVATHFL